MSADKNREQNQDLRETGFQKLFIGVVLIFGAGCIAYMAYLSGKGPGHAGRALGMVAFAGLYGVWNVVRGVICFFRPQSKHESQQTKTSEKKHRKHDA
jgi:hypothetical protein